MRGDNQELAIEGRHCPCRAVDAAHFVLLRVN